MHLFIALSPWNSAKFGPEVMGYLRQHARHELDSRCRPITTTALKVTPLGFQ